MTLRRQAVLFACTTLLLLPLFLCYFTNRILLVSFRHLEESFALKNIQRVQDIFLEHIQDIDVVATDWAQWDDTYDFLHNPNRQYLSSNMVPSTFDGLRLNLIILLDTKGKRVFSDGYDLVSGKRVAVPERLIPELVSAGLIPPSSDSLRSASGILSLPGGPLLISLQPVLTSEAKGPPAGIIIMGRFLNGHEVSGISRIMRLPVIFTPIPGSGPGSERSGNPVLPRMWTTAENDSIISGHAILAGINGRPALHLRADMPRHIIAYGREIVWKFSFLLILVVTIYGAVSLTLHFGIISRLLRLSREVGTIGEKGDFSGRVTIRGNDEITAFSEEMNRMLGSLEQSERNLRLSEERLRAQYKGIPLPTSTWKWIGEDFVLVDYNTAALEMTDGKITTVVGRAAGDLFRGHSALLDAFNRCYAEQSRFTFESSGRHLIIPGERFFRYSLNYVPPEHIIIHMDDITERRQVEQKLLTTRKRLRSLTSRISSAEERERRRIAVYLHDNIGHILALCQFRIEAIQEKASRWKLRSNLEEVRQTVLEAIGETRSLTTQLCPPVLYELGLSPAIEWLAEHMSSRYGLRIGVRHNGGPEIADHDLRGFLFQSVRELLFNVVKHAEAGSAIVEIRTTEKEVIIAVIDDGRGFDTGRIESVSEESGGFGLFNIRERTDHIGGSVSVHASPGSGSRVEITVPLLPARSTHSEPHSTPN